MPTAFTPAQRAIRVAYTIDPGFVHFRRIETVVGFAVMATIDRQTRALPQLPEGLRLTRLRQIYTRALLCWCHHTDAPPLALRMSTGQGGIFCSVETLAGCGQFPGEGRVVNLRTDPTGDQPVEVHYSAEHVSTSTLRSLHTWR